MNGYWRHRALETAGKLLAVTYVTHEGKDYQQTIRQMLLERKAWYHSEHCVEVFLLVCFRDERKQDIDNRVKPFLDALKNGGLIKDDSQVKRLEVRQGPTMKQPAIFATVREFIPDRVANLEWIKQPQPPIRIPETS
jgi:Holliday junction resolvase RusA-like endonuclease